MKKNILLACLFTATVILPINIVMAALPSGYFNVRDYGAVGDGKIIDSEAINKAIDVASAVGGGTVYIPTGTYGCYSIRLKNNISLFIDHGAVIYSLAATEANGYDEAEPNGYDEY